MRPTSIAKNRFGEALQNRVDRGLAAGGRP
jgi:hypothetical protein